MKYKIFVVIVMATLLSGCIGSIDSSKYGALERWRTFNGYSPKNKVGDKQSRVFIYRGQGDIKGPAVNIFVNDDYLTSLLGGGYKTVVICSYGSKLLPSFSRNYRFADRNKSIDYNFLTGQDSYLKVISNGDKKLAFQQVSYEQWKEEAKYLKPQTQTLPRVKPNSSCEKAIIGKKTLSINSLFKFDKYQYQDLLPKGKLEIKNLGKEYKKQDLGIISMRLIGYTDPQGSEEYNLKLSKHRVETIKLALQKEGINVPISTESLGKNNLVVPDCAMKFPNNRRKRIQCDQPNRRVDIIFYAEKYLN